MLCKALFFYVPRASHANWWQREALVFFNHSPIIGRSSEHNERAIVQPVKQILPGFDQERLIQYDKRSRKNVETAQSKTGLS